jgi:hypothetical protein
MATHPSDKGAAFIGLIVTATALVLLASTIVMLTNRRFAHEKSEPPTATTPR